MAGLFRSDPDEFNRRCATGRAYFYDEFLDDDAGWMEILVQSMDLCMPGHRGPLVAQYSIESDVWEICCYPTTCEFVGGRFDGGRVTPEFSLDLRLLRSVFGHLDRFSWDIVRCESNEFEICITLTGEYHGHEIEVRLHGGPTEDVPPGRRIDMSDVH